MPGRHGNRERFKRERPPAGVRSPASLRSGTGWDSLDRGLQATKMLLAGSAVVAAGYGWSRRRIASRAAGAGGREEHFRTMKGGARVANGGRFDVELDLKARAAEVLARDPGRPANRVHKVPNSVDYETVRMKLDAMGIGLDRLTLEQDRKPASGHLGT